MKEGDTIDSIRKGSVENSPAPSLRAKPKKQQKLPYTPSVPRHLIAQAAKPNGISADSMAVALDNLGGMSVALMINGKLTSMSREQVVTLLKSMPASRVQNAEVMYSAPARYQVRGALINITLEKDASKDASL